MKKTDAKKITTTLFDSQVEAEYESENSAIKAKVIRSYRIDRQMADKIAEVSKRLGVTETTVVRAALRQALL